MWWTTPASAADLDVPSLSYPTVDAALSAAAAGDRIVVSGPQSAPSLPVAVPVTFIGVTVDAALVNAGLAGLDLVTAAADVVFIDLRLDGAYVQRALAVQPGHTVTLDHVVVEHGYSPSDGGCVSIGNGSVLRTSGASILRLCAASTSGGAIAAASGSTLDLQDTLLQDNSAGTDGGAVSTGSGVVVTGQGATFQSNRATFAGGAVALGDSSTFTLPGLTARNNAAGTVGGALACPMSCVVALTGGALSTNGTATEGGHLYLSAGSATLTGVQLDSGVAAFGGALRSLDATVTLTDVVFDTNTASDDGGAVSLERGVFCDNSATDSGGAIHVRAAGNAIAVTNTTFLDNASNDKGALRVQSRALTVRHGTFVGNTAAMGAAIDHDASDALVVENSVFVAQVGIAAINVTTGTGTLEHDGFFGNSLADTNGAVYLLNPVILVTDPLPTRSRCSVLVPPLDGDLVDVADDADLDGTPGDLGATGGPDADPVRGLDADGDGVSGWWDCDDTNGQRFPGNPENPLTPIDEDCDPATLPGGDSGDTSHTGGGHTGGGHTGGGHTGDAPHSAHTGDHTAHTGGGHTAHTGAGHTGDTDTDTDTDSDTDTDTDSDTDSDADTDSDTDTDTDTDVGSIVPADPGCSCATRGPVGPLWLLAVAALVRRARSRG